MYGIEREGLRIDELGCVATTAHPKPLGSKLTHPYFTTDFAEAQLEIVTKPFATIEGALRQLAQLHSYAYHEAGCRLWPLSMPPPVDQIIVADFGPSRQGREKRLYREGLLKRYPAKMQLISGIHANYSLEGDLMAICRNYLRYGWLVSYLFGASCSAQYPFATSLRMSPKGYYSRVQSQMKISFDSYEAYQKDLKKASQTPHPPYAGHGLNGNLLQIPAEHYSRIRPKEGYLEVRSLDLNPSCPLGVDFEALDFVKRFLEWCGREKSPLLSQNEMQMLIENQNLVALYGRRENLRLKTLAGPKQMRAAACEILDKMGEKKQLAKVMDPDKTPSAYLYRALKAHRGDIVKLGLSLLHTYPKPRATKKLKELAKQSLHEEMRLDLEASVQLLMREAQRKGIQIEVLDKAHNIIRLGDQIVQQATRTAKDNYITPLLMNNKAVTKQLLQEAGLVVPGGFCFETEEEAINYYKSITNKKVVIKPNTAHSGRGIHFILPRNKKAFIEAVYEAFSFSSNILIEPFCAGREYRFLVVGKKIIGVLKRDPANVVGDGKHSVKELIALKNQHKTYPILAAGNDLVPKKGRKIYLAQNSNVSTGGDAIDVTDRIHRHYKSLAMHAAQVMSARICGVDMLIPKITAPGNYTIIEMNDNPMLSMHANPHRGKARNPAPAILQLLGL